MERFGKPGSGKQPWSVARLQNGAILGTIAHAIGVAADPVLSYELSWDGVNYSRQDSQGTRGTVTFAADNVVAVFRDDNSERLKAPKSAEAMFSLDRFFRGMPEDLRALAENEALQYMLDEYEGKVAPVITAAFWGQGEKLVAAEAWEQVLEQGAHLIRRELAEAEVAIGEWASEYELTGGQISLLHGLYGRKIEGIDSEIKLGKDEYDVLMSQGDKGIVESRELLASIGIMLPE